MNDLEKCLLFDPASTDWLEDCVKEVAYVGRCDPQTAQALIEATIRYDKLCKARNISIIEYNRGPDVPGELLYAISAITQQLRYAPTRLQSLKAVVDFIERDAPLHFQGTLLDYGGGGGRDSIAFARKGLRVTLSDTRAYLGTPSEGPTIARRFEGRNLKVDFVPVAAEPWKDYFDYANCIDVLEHCYDMENALVEITHQLKPGGYFFVWGDFDNIVYNGDHVEKNRFYARSGVWPHLMKELGYTLAANCPHGAAVEIWKLEEKAGATFEDLLRKAYGATNAWAKGQLFPVLLKALLPWLKVSTVRNWWKVARSGQDTSHPFVRKFHPRTRALQDLSDTFYTFDLSRERLRTLAAQEQRNGAAAPAARVPDRPRDPAVSAKGP